MFNSADLTYQRVQNNMSMKVALACLDRIREHTQTHGTKEFRLTLHGGEPTLWPLKNFQAFLDHAERLRSDGLNLAISLQSNGVRLPDDLIELLAAHRVSIGISLDGPREHHDAFRVTHGGRRSYDRIMANVDAMLSSDYRALMGGFLSVANPDIPPIEYLDWVDSLPIRRVDVLWPMQFHYASPPWPRGEEAAYSVEPQYGVWFAELFRSWWERDDPTLYIRFFFDVIQTLMGWPKHVENIVNDTVPMFVVNTDGAVEYHDYFRSAADGATRTSMNVLDHKLDEAAADRVFEYLLNLGSHLPEECHECKFRRVCGGGFLPGRMEPGQMPPRRRSVLCYDEYYFFREITRIIGPTLVPGNLPLSPLKEALRPEAVDSGPPRRLMELKTDRLATSI
jgi:uncharacterized protein